MKHEERVRASAKRFIDMASACTREMNRQVGHLETVVNRTKLKSKNGNGRSLPVEMAAPEPVPEEPEGEETEVKDDAPGQLSEIDGG